jgi:pimeloyl-ACP methyl ester carboxylesterase
MSAQTVQTVDTSDGLRLAVQHRGEVSAPVVVAVHGYPDDHTVWDGVAADLAADHHVVTYDVRGAGASDAPHDRAGYDLDRLEDDLAAVIDAVSPDRPVHLLAHDWGSIACWHAVTGERLAGRIASYTSISGPSLDHAARWFRDQPIRDRLRQAAASWYIVLFRLPVIPELVWRCGLGARILAGTEGVPRPATRDAVNGLELYRRNIGARTMNPRARTTDVPVQVLAPTGDRYVTPALQAAARGHARDLRIRRVAGGHWVIRTRPDEIARHVREHTTSRPHHGESGGSPGPARASGEAGDSGW